MISQKQKSNTKDFSSSLYILKKSSIKRTTTIKTVYFCNDKYYHDILSWYIYSSNYFPGTVRSFQGNSIIAGSLVCAILNLEYKSFKMTQMDFSTHPFTAFYTFMFTQDNCTLTRSLVDCLPLTGPRQRYGDVFWNVYHLV